MAEGVKLLLLVDDTMIYVKNSKVSIKTPKFIILTVR